MRHDDIRQKALKDLRDAHVLMVDGHFDYGNGYHGRVYVNPHQLFQHPASIWRFAQDLLDILPASIVSATDIVAGPVTGGALLAHTVAGLLDSRRNLTHPPCSFAPFEVDRAGVFKLRSFYGALMAGKRVLLADDVRNTGLTLERCAKLVEAQGGTVVATAEICDRMEAVVNVEAPNFALAEFKAPANFEAHDCPLCKSGLAVTRF